MTNHLRKNLGNININFGDINIFSCDNGTVAMFFKKNSHLLELYTERFRIKSYDVYNLLQNKTEWEK